MCSWQMGLRALVLRDILELIVAPFCAVMSCAMIARRAKMKFVLQTMIVKDRLVLQARSA